MNIDYGTDFDTSNGLTFTPISGLDVIGQCIVRMLSDARKGIDVREWLNEDLVGHDMQDMQQTIRSVCLRDERIASASATVTQVDRLQIKINLAITPSDGSKPFALVLAVTQLSVQVLNSP